MNIERLYAVVFEPDAWESLMDLPERTQDRILDAIYALEHNPRPGTAKAMQGAWHGHYRVRVGDYRVVYVIEHDVLRVLVVKVGDRKNVYR